MKATIRWLDGVRFEGESGSGHKVVIDGPPDLGGRNAGVRPMELLLLGLGGCTAFDVMLILTRGRHAVSGCEVELEAERAPVEPKVFTHIRLHYTLRGRGLSEKIVDRAIHLSAEKYCSASVMLGKTARIEHTFTIVEEP